MRRVLFMLLDAMIAAAVFAPIFLCLNQRIFHSKRKSIWYFLFAVYLAGVYAVVGLPDICYMRLNFHINFKPFAYMFSDYANTLLNILLFIPMGFFLPVFVKRYDNPVRTVLFGLILSTAIELMQIFTFRATDINDLMTNTAGTLLGWCIGRLFIRLIPGYPLEKNHQHMMLIFAVSFGVMFFLHPLIAGILFSL